MRLDRKAFGRIATTFVATAMLAAFAAVPASAENAEVTFTKTIDMEHAFGATVPTISYSYVISAGTPVEASSAANTPEIKAGEATDFSIRFPNGEGNANIVSFGPQDTVNEQTKKVSKQGTMVFGEDAYSAPGIYRYNVKETPNNQVEGLEYNDSMDPAYIVDVYVAYNDQGDLEVTHAVWMREEITPTFTADDAVRYGDGVTEVKIDGDEDAYTTYTLTIEKQVEGKMADAGRAYDFHVNLSNLTQGTKVSFGANQENAVEYGTAANSDGKILLDNLSIRPTETVTIYGLPASAIYQVAEELNASEGYSVSAKLNAKDPMTMSANATKDAYESVNVSLKQDNTDSTISDTFVVTNKRESVTPTGVLLNVAPYALMVIIAAAGCFVFLRKRRDD